MEMETEIQNPIAVEPSLQALALQNQVFEASIHLVRDPDPIVESTARVESRNQINYDSNDDLMIVTPTTVEIKCEQQELTFDNSIENCNPNIMIDLLNDDNTIIIKTEVNDENVAPNRANAIERPIRHNVMTKKPPKPIVERCVGRICAPKKRPRLTSGTMADGIAGGAAAAVSEINESENETISDSENDSISQVGGQSADTEPGIVDATDFNLVAIAFHGSISDLEGPHYDQQAVRVPNIPYCPQCKSLHASKRALQSHYTTKKHKSRTIHLARDAALAGGSCSPVLINQDPVRATNRPQPIVPSGDPSLHCQVCKFSYSTKKTMTKHLRSLKHAENFTKLQNIRFSLESGPN